MLESPNFEQRMAKIIVQGSDGRREYELGAVTSIGRHPDNAIQILDRIVSKEHAQIIKQPHGKFLYRDLGSLNGSFFANERISERLLIDGDEMLLGSTQVQFKQKNTEAVVQQVTIEPAPSET